MTTSPSEPVDNAQPSDDDAGTDAGAPSQGDTLPFSTEPTGRGADVDDQDAEPTSTAPAADNPTVPDPPD